jgi:alpha-glucosidase (family GH31 glycosyl hydrolase)
MDTNHSATLTIVHSPHGAGSSYFVGMEERVPRDPVGGDMVGIGFLTTPGRCAGDVALHWTRNGKRQPPIGGRVLARHTDYDRWLVEIGVIEAGDQVEYWIVAEIDRGRVESPHYHFVARRWRTLAACPAMEKLADGVRLATVDSAGARGPLLEIHQLAPNALRVDMIDVLQAEHAEPSPATVAVSSGSTSLVVESASGRMTLQPAQGAQIAPLRLRWLEEGDGCLVGIELTGALEDDERLVGFGERFNALDQRGRTLDSTVYEQYKNQGNRTYLPTPFFLSSRGYGCLVEGTGSVFYDLGRTIPDRWRCLALCDNSTHIAIDLLSGSPLDLVRMLTQLTGRPDAPPPDWVFGPWMSSNEWNTQARVEREVALTQMHDIPATVLVIEAWSDETTFYTWNGAHYQPRSADRAPRLAEFSFPTDGPWPDPKGMIDSLHAAGIRLLLWQIPALKHTEEPHPQHDSDVAFALEQGYVIRHKDGSVYRNPAFWFNQAYIPDFTSPAAVDWWLAKRAYLLQEMGVDGFKTDGGEHLQGSDIVAFDGSTGSELVNAFPNRYVGAYYRFARTMRSGDAITFSRAGYTGAGAFPIHWAGDENSSWEAFRRSIIAGLTAGLSGVLFWGWDIAGFSDALPSAELYLRATAMAAFCPIMQYHSEYTPRGAPCKDRTPWNIQANSGDERVIPYYHFFAHLRMKLLPYLVREAAYAATHGEPLMRALLLDFPDDPIAWGMEDEYCLGRDLLIAPVVEEGATTRRVYLPHGDWRDFWTNAEVCGGRWLDVAAPLDRIPVFVKAGAAPPVVNPAAAASM